MRVGVLGMAFIGLAVATVLHAGTAQASGAAPNCGSHDLGSGMLGVPQGLGGNAVGGNGSSGSSVPGCDSTVIG